MKKFFFLAIVIILSTSCSTTKKTSTTPDEQSVDKSEVLELNGDSDSGKAGKLRTVYFDYKSSELSSSARNILNDNIVFISAHPEIEVQIEGHTDERGSAQYNLTLGEKRARSVMLYMMAKGIDQSRLEKVSIGKEKPKAHGHDEEAWSQNRRANFIVTRK